MRNAVLFTLAASLLHTAAAQNGMTGSWRGSGGSVFRISSTSGAFSLILIEPKGGQKNFPAVWEKPGEKFTWTDAQQSKHTAVLEKEHKPIRIRDVGESFPDSPAYWYFVPK